MKKKTLLIVIIILVVILVLAGGTFAYLYFGTGLLKSNKELFAKYMTQIGEEQNGFASTVLNDYINRKETTAYQNNGTFTVNTRALNNTSLEETLYIQEDLINIANNTNISFQGNIDRINQKTEENIVINYTDTVNLPFTYKQDGDVYGIQADILSPSYIAVRNDNLPDLLQKMGATDTTEVPYKIEEQVIESLQFSEEEKTHIITNYILPIYNNLTEEKFTKVENADGTIDYTLTLTYEEGKAIILQILQTLSNDTTMLSKINSINQEINGENADTITSQDVQSLITDLNETTPEEGTISIAVTAQNDATRKISIIDSNGGNISITKENNDSNLTYSLDIVSNNDSTIKMEISYAGLNTNTTTENINVTVQLGNEVEIVYSFQNTVTFGNAVNIDSFGEDTIILNDYSAEQVQSLEVQIVYIIDQTNISQMEQIGFSTEYYYNPMILWFMTPSAYSVRNNLINRAEKARDYYANDTAYTDDAVANTSSYFDEYINSTFTN